MLKVNVLAPGQNFKKSQNQSHKLIFYGEKMTWHVGHRVSTLFKVTWQDKLWFRVGDDDLLERSDVRCLDSRFCEEDEWDLGTHMPSHPTIKNHLFDFLL